MGLGFGISALVLAVLGVIVPVPANGYVTIGALICTLIAAYNGEKPFTISAVALIALNYALLSPVTLRLVELYFSEGPGNEKSAWIHVTIWGNIVLFAVSLLLLAVRPYAPWTQQK